MMLDPVSVTDVSAAKPRCFRKVSIRDSWHTACSTGANSSDAVSNGPPEVFLQGGTSGDSQVFAGPCPLPQGGSVCHCRNLPPAAARGGGSGDHAECGSAPENVDRQARGARGARLVTQAR